ncbi:hypothetical protein Avbf_08549 [Armadillidium vulgare]|nr:hypothetical protein Avbf_08549 [Armadillidium vulgare]
MYSCVYIKSHTLPTIDHKTQFDKVNYILYSVTHVSRFDVSSHDFEYLLKNISPYSCSTYSPLGTVDTEEGILAPCSWGHEQGNMSSLLPLQNIPRKSSYETKNIRDEFAEYFTTVGKVA